MIKVLDKALAILELLATTDGAGQVSWLAEKSGIPLPTCSRILKELVRSGYVSQVSRAEGFILGPRAHVFGQMVNYRPALLAASRPAVRELAEKTRTSVFICERSGFSRYILFHHSARRRQLIKLQRLSYEDLLDTATGLLFTALADKKAQTQILTHYHHRCGLLPPGGDLTALLARIAADKFYICPHKAFGDQAIMAYPVWQNSSLVAVLGCSIENEFFAAEGEALTAACAETARRISEAISYKDITG